MKADRPHESTEMKLAGWHGLYLSNESLCLEHKAEEAKLSWEFRPCLRSSGELGNTDRSVRPDRGNTSAAGMAAFTS